MCRVIFDDHFIVTCLRARSYDVNIPVSIILCFIINYVDLNSFLFLLLLDFYIEQFVSNSHLFPMKLIMPMALITKQ